MIWLTWRQFRAQAYVMFGAVAVFVVVLAITGGRLADLYHAGMAACRATGTCDEFTNDFFRGHKAVLTGLAVVTVVVPGLLGLFWGAPLLSRELETGTHRLVWSQSVTRTRWLAVKLGLVGVAAVVVTGAVSFAVTWWSGPVEDAMGPAYVRLSPVTFAAQDIAPMGYAGFAFVLGVVAGMLVRRTIPAMALTLAVFVAVQLAMPLWIRPHLVPPEVVTTAITAENLHGIGVSGPDGVSTLTVGAGSPGAWILSSETVDGAGQPVTTLPGWVDGCLSVPSGHGVTQPQQACLARLADAGYRQRITYQPGSRFWLFQGLETGIFAALTAALGGFGFWWIRRRLS